MIQYNFPTTILFGQGALKELAERMQAMHLKKPMIVTDQTLKKMGLVDQVTASLQSCGMTPVIFADTHPNPIEDDVTAVTKLYKEQSCDSVVALGGGSPMDTAKVLLITSTHEGALEKYDAAKKGYELLQPPFPPFFAIPTTAGTGSEVGRSGVIILKKTNTKTTFFHPQLLPKIAVLEPELTVGLPPLITAATGIDAFTHCLEAYFVPAFSPLCDGIALEGLRLILENLPIAVRDGKNLDARGKMLIAASMGATAFQKDLGMTHSLAHPLSAECGLHHGLANALLLPFSLAFIEGSKLSDENQKKITRILDLFKEYAVAEKTLAASCQSFFAKLGINFGLRNHGVKNEQLSLLASKAFQDPCHTGNMIPVTEQDLLQVYEKAF